MACFRLSKTRRTESSSLVSEVFSVVEFEEDLLSSQLAKIRNKQILSIEIGRIMDFQDFKNRIPKLKKIALPGEEAQFKLAPNQRIEELARLNVEPNNPSHAGVMAVFYPGEAGNTQLVLILRKTYKGVHSNQVGFPGGRVEPEDENLQQTALRETEEEVGIPRQEIEVVKSLTKLYIPPSNFWVHPFIGVLEKTPVLVPQESEVESILEVKLSDFLAEETLISRKLTTSYAEDLDVPAFLLNDHVVWGATAMMLSEIKVILQRTIVR